MNKRADVIFIGVVLLGAAILWGLSHLGFQKADPFLLVRIDGEEYGRYSFPPEKGRELRISLPGADGGSNLLVISSQSASVTWADCPDQLCVRQRSISRQGQCIICLPHKLVIQVEQGKEGETDAVAY